MTPAQPEKPIFPGVTPTNPERIFFYVQACVWGGSSGILDLQPHYSTRHVHTHALNSPPPHQTQFFLFCDPETPCGSAHSMSPNYCCRSVLPSIAPIYFTAHPFLPPKNQLPLFPTVLLCLCLSPLPLFHSMFASAQPLLYTAKLKSPKSSRICYHTFIFIASISLRHSQSQQLSLLPPSGHKCYYRKHSRAYIINKKSQIASSEDKAKNETK